MSKHNRTEITCESYLKMRREILVSIEAYALGFVVFLL